MGLPQLAKLLEETILEKSARSDSRGNSSLDEIRSELLDGAGRLAAAARRVMRWQAMLTCLAVGLAVLLLLMLGDMLLRREELGLRVLSLLAWLLVLGWSVNKWLRPAWRFSLTPVQVAQWIEGERPELEQRLSTAVELAHLPAADTRFGSSLFRDAALRAWSGGSAFDWSRHLEQRGLRAGTIARGRWSDRGSMDCVADGNAIGFADWLCRGALWPHRDQLHILQLPTVVAAGSELQWRWSMSARRYQIAWSCKSANLTLLRPLTCGRSKRRSLAIWLSAICRRSTQPLRLGPWVVMISDALATGRSSTATGAD
ncbi:MAG: hypothetical protein R3C56_00385 [Pirellulaceae bacterium]